MNKRLWIILAAAGIAAAYVAVSTLAPGGGPRGADFRLDSLSGERFYLHDQRGKCVVLVFWSTMCDPCKAELAYLSGLQRELADDRLVVAGICTDAEGPDRVRRAVEPLDVDFPILLDTTGEVAPDWQATVVPTTVIIDADGKVAWRRTGYDATVGRAIRSQIERILARLESDR